MDYGVEPVDVERVFLHLENPRHEPLTSEAQAIQYLCESENVLELAKDIVAHGLNPLEHFGLIPEGNDTYIAVEGNRRLCALKLLRDPDRAPNPGQRRAFERLAAEWEPIEEVRATVFENRRDVKLWLERIHGGAAGGRGRRGWNAEQKARHTGYRKNLPAQKILDAGEKRGFITKAARKGRLSTVQRYLSNPIFRHVLGLDVGQPEDVTTELLDNDFNILFKRFMEDVAAKKVHTRHHKQDIDRYANKLSQTPGLSGGRTAARSIQEAEEEDKPTPRRPKRPKGPTWIALSEELESALEEAGNFKLQKIYYSVCKLKLSEHTPLLTVGMWVFLETLTALVGRDHKTSFPSYLNAQRLQQLGMGTKRKTKTLREAVQRLSESGNTTKHNQTAAAFNGDTLANDVATMEDMLIALAKEAENCK